jgi:hypothetical protein
MFNDPASTSHEGALYFVHSSRPGSGAASSSSEGGQQLELDEKPVPAQLVDATPSHWIDFSKGGVYDTRKTGQTFRGAAPSIALITPSISLCFSAPLRSLPPRLPTRGRPTDSLMSSGMVHSPLQRKLSKPDLACATPWKPLMSLELECGDGLLLLRPVTPLTQRDVVYLYSGAHILGRRPFPLLALGDNGKVLLKKKLSQRQMIAFTAEPGNGDCGKFTRPETRRRELAENDISGSVVASVSRTRDIGRGLPS